MSRALDRKASVRRDAQAQLDAMNRAEAPTPDYRIHWPSALPYLALVALALFALGLQPPA